MTPKRLKELREEYKFEITSNQGTADINECMVEIENLQAENKKYKKALIKISLWRHDSVWRNEAELPENIAKQILKGE